MRRLRTYGWQAHPPVVPLHPRTPGAEMVAIVSGMRSGLQLTRVEVLGFRDAMGGRRQGGTGQEVTVNVSQGQLVAQDQDDLLVGVARMRPSCARTTAMDRSTTKTATAGRAAS